jgi:hypothetical protein
MMYGTSLQGTNYGSKLTASDYVLK